MRKRAPVYRARYILKKLYLITRSKDVVAVMDEEKLLTTVLLLWIAEYETTLNFLANGVFSLLTNSGQLQTAPIPTLHRFGDRRNIAIQ